jgi:hypothetical protein
MRAMILLRLAVLALSALLAEAPAAGVSAAPSQLSATAARAMKEPLDDLTRDVEHMHPVAMFVLAKRLFDAGRLDDSVFWFYEGQLRWKSYLQYSNASGPFGEADRYGVFFEDLGPDINWCAADNLPALLKTYDKVLDWDASHPDDFTPNGPVKDAQRKGLKDLSVYMVAHADELKKAHEQKTRTCPLDQMKDPDNPYTGDGGALFAVPDEMVGDYDTALFSSFRTGTTTKREVVKALGAPDFWFTDKDGSTSLTYSYHKALGGIPGFAMSQRVSVTFKFDSKRVLSRIELPKEQ